MTREHRIALAVIPRFGRHRGVGGLEGGVKRMGIEALYRKPNTSKPAPGHKIYPYLLARPTPTARRRPGAVRSARRCVR